MQQGIVTTEHVSIQTVIDALYYDGHLLGIEIITGAGILDAVLVYGNCVVILTVLSPGRNAIDGLTASERTTVRQAAVSLVEARGELATDDLTFRFDLAYMSESEALHAQPSAF